MEYFLRKDTKMGRLKKGFTQYKVSFTLKDGEGFNKEILEKFEELMNLLKTNDNDREIQKEI